jgi:hypothetical protein
MIRNTWSEISPLPLLESGARGGAVVEALRCKPESRRFDSHGVTGFFH